MAGAGRLAVHKSDDGGYVSLCRAIGVLSRFSSMQRSFAHGGTVAKDYLGLAFRDWPHDTRVNLLDFDACRVLPLTRPLTHL